MRKNTGTRKDSTNRRNAALRRREDAKNAAGTDGKSMKSAWRKRLRVDFKKELA